MNILYLFNAFTKKFSHVLYDAYFKLILKPLYKLLFFSGGNTFRCNGKMRHCSLKVLGGGNLIVVDDDCVLNKVRIEVKGKNNKLILHKGVIFSEGGRIRIEDECNVIEIGENSLLVNCFLSSADKNTSMSIGKNSFFSSDVIIRTSDSHSILKEDTGERINDGADVIIGDNVWICNGVRIMKGTQIGSDCVVGSNAIVAGLKSSGNCLIVGCPGKVAKTGIKWTKKRIY